MTEPSSLLRQEIAAMAEEIHRAGWVANHDGNITVLLDNGNLLATPTAISKRRINVDRILTLDSEGKVLEGNGKPFGELNLHRAAYGARPDVRAVVHAHPPYACAFAVTGQEVDPTILAEAVVSIGAQIPRVPYKRPGSPESATVVAQALRENDAIILENHGVLSVGEDVEQAFLRMELVEHLSRITSLGMGLGTIKKIPQGDVEALLKKRAQAGLGPQGRRQRQGPTSVTGTVLSNPGDLETLVRQEIQRVLGR